MTESRILIAGIGNIFLGDDAFGVEVVQQLARQPLTDGVRVVDFGIRGYDLAYALLDDYEVAILVDAMPRGGEPGTLYLIEPDLNNLNAGAQAEIDAHSLEPVKVLQLVHTLGGKPRRVLVLGCEPASYGEDEDFLVSPAGLSEPVQTAIPEALKMLDGLVKGLLLTGQPG